MQWTASRRELPGYKYFALLLLAIVAFAPTLHAESFFIDFRWKPNAANMVTCDFSILDIQAAPDLGPGHAAGKKFFSYMSVGQIAGDAPYLVEVLTRGIRMLSYNAEWDSHYPDLSDPRWADYVVWVLAPIAINKGFDGFFLDTVDAVETLSSLQPNRAAAYHAGMVNIIQGLKSAYPTKQIILNRGFAVFDSVKTSVKGMLVEELFQRDDYTARSASGVSQLLARIEPVKQAGLPVYIVDYVPPDNLALADSTSERISNLGFHPLIVPQSLHGIILAPRRPAVTSQPTGGAAAAGASYAFSVAASGTPPLTYQWRRDGQEIAGARSSTLALSNLAASQAGQYAVEIRNAGGSITSATATLTVVIADADNDQMPDDWERLNGLNTSHNDAAADADGDGSNNLHEYRCGTNPRDARNCLKLDVKLTPNRDLLLSFEAMPARTYTIQYSTSPANGIWQRVHDFDATTSNQRVSVTYRPGATTGARCFRIVSPRMP